MSFVNGYRRPFALTNPAISYPLRPNIVPFSVAAVVSLVAPVVIITVLSIFPIANHSPKGIARRLRNRLRNINAGCSGLCLSLATALFITEGLKTIVGKPRPNMLATCHPDLTKLRIYAVGGLGTSLDSEAPILVSSAICSQTSQHTLRDAFSSFPSGHSSFSWAGLLYLSLWLCAKLSVQIPYLSHQQHTSTPARTDHQSSLPPDDDHPQRPQKSNRGATPPLYLLLLAVIPTGVALFISASRYADFHHAGIDIFVGSVIGILTACASFRLYHMPIRRARGQPWGSRTLGGSLSWFRSRSSWSGSAATDVEADAECEMGVHGGGQVPTTAAVARQERGTSP